MITMLKGWNGPVKINGTDYTSINEYLGGNTRPEGKISIMLYPQKQTAVNDPLKRVVEGRTENEHTEYIITVKKYMTEPSAPGFDFMSKWNNDNPMPMRTMTGWVEKETKGMYYMHLKGTAEATVNCSCCGKVLTNPISRHYGIGPVCLAKLGIMNDIADIAGIKEKLVNIEWTGWVIKSAITEMEEV